MIMAGFQGDSGEAASVDGDDGVIASDMDTEVQPPPEITWENQRPRTMRAPRAPSRQERTEHEIAHCPFRVWCEECVAGKSHAKAHFTGTAGSPDGEVPLVAFDYAFMSSSKIGERKSDDEELEKTGQVKILVGRDRKSKCYSAIPVPCKGVDEGEYATRRVLRFLDVLGYENLILKSDQEFALGKVLRSAKVHRGANTQTMLENSPVGDSRSNGFIESAVGRVEGQVRTLKLALEKHLGHRLAADACVLTWLVQHAGNTLTMFEIGDDGKNPYQRLRGKKFRAELIEFGEQVQFMPLDVKKQGKLEARWVFGTFLGLRLESGESLVGTPDGVFKTRSVRRRTEDVRWSVKAIEELKGVPWKPYQFSDSDRLLIKMPVEVDPKDVVMPARKQEDDPAPRGFSINKK